MGIMVYSFLIMGNARFMSSTVGTPPPPPAPVSKDWKAREINSERPKQGHKFGIKARQRDQALGSRV